LVRSIDLRGQPPVSRASRMHVLTWKVPMITSRKAVSSRMLCLPPALAKLWTEVISDGDMKVC
jgi:hypothetical protein